jgi:hypothetical protein
MNNIFGIISGILLVVAGRKLYWLFVAIVGFVAGFTLANRFIETDADWVKWLVGIGVGILGGILAVGLQKIAVAIAGFIAGGYGLVYFLETVGVMMEDTRWLFFVVGGIIGAVLVLAIFEFALIILSSVVGSSMISQNFDLSGWLLTAAFLLLVLVGILIQWATLRNEGKRVTST